MGIVNKRLTAWIASVFVVMFLLVMGTNAYAVDDATEEQPPAVASETTEEKEKPTQNAVSEKKNVPQKAPAQEDTHEYEVKMIWPNGGHDVFEAKYKGYKYQQHAYLLLKTGDTADAKIVREDIYLDVEVGNTKSQKFSGPATIDGEKITSFECHLIFDKPNPFRFGYALSGSKDINKSCTVELRQIMANNVEVQLNMPQDVQDLNTRSLQDLLDASSRIRLSAEDCWKNENTCYLSMKNIPSVLSKVETKTLAGAKNIKTGQFHILDGSVVLSSYGGDLPYRLGGVPLYSLFSPYTGNKSKFTLQGSMQDEGSIKAADSIFTLDGAITGDDLNGWLMKLKIADQYIKTVTIKPSDKAEEQETTVKLVQGDTLKTPIADPTAKDKTAYKFAGWFTDEALTKPFDAKSPVNDDITLYAKWEKKTPSKPYYPINKYTIIVDPNGGNWKGDTAKKVEIYDEGATFTLPEAPMKEGYTFLYWKGSEYQPGEKYIVKEDHTFTAEWKKNSTPQPAQPSDGHTPGAQSGNTVSKEKTAPKTGEDARRVVYAGLAVILGVSIVVLRKNKKKNDYK